MVIWFPGQSYLLRAFSNYVLLRIASGRCVYVSGRCGCVLVVGNASMLDLLYMINVGKITVNLA